MSVSANKMIAFAKKYANYMAASLSDSPIFFAVMLVQASQESAYGTSYNAVRRNNFFGIMKNGSYRTFSSPQECFDFYISVLLSARYTNTGVSIAQTPYEQVRAIADAGYYSANNDYSMPASQLPPNKVWTKKESADRYYNQCKKLLDEILLKIPIGKISSVNYSASLNLIAKATTV